MRVKGRLSTFAVGAFFIVLFMIFAFVLSVLARNQGLSRFLEAERTNPLFDFPGASREDLAQIAGILSRANEKTAADESLSVFGERVFPSKFWESAAKVKDARESFLKDPTRDNASALIKAEKDAALFYSEGAESFGLIWERETEKSKGQMDQNTPFLFLPGVESDIPTFGKALADIKRNGGLLSEAVRSRGICLDFGWCYGIKSSSAGISKTQLEIEAPRRILPAEYLESALSQIGVSLSGIYFGIKSPCFNGPAWFALWNRRFSSSTYIFFPKLITDSFYRAVNDSDKLPQNEILKTQKIPYSWQPETNPYLCPDLSYYTKLASMLWVQNKIKDMNSGLSSGFADETQMDKIVLSLQSSSSDPKVASIIKTWETQTGNLAEVFKAIMADNSRYETMAQSSTSSLVPIVTALTHGYPSITFAVQNPTVWRLSEKPAFVNTGFVEPGRMESISNFENLSRKFTLSEILRFQSETLEGSKFLWQE